MTPEYWKKLGDLVEQALAFEAEERSAFLARACGEDKALKEHVEQFIAAYEEDRDFLEDPAIPGFSLEDSTTPAQYVGDYKIIRPLGMGGMGEVFLAHKKDGPVHHPVALKLIRAGKELQGFTMSRFLVEQQVLSELVHPNITRILDVGTTEEGRPFFVMEYVDGLPITEYCDRYQLTVNDRLKLFLQVCNAVQFAHHNLVVHRDIKPSNLLVTREGQVKLLDFGIAKVFSPWQQRMSVLTTETGFRVFTTPYASPEQVGGKPITTTSDVYSLGVLLYELLAGRRPHKLAERLEHEVVRVILEEQPVPPSDAVTQGVEITEDSGDTHTLTPDAVSATRQTTARRLQRKLKGEIDNIVLMALRKEPGRRYGSAAALGDDIRRFLEGMPVDAQPDSLSYKVGKFVTRHPWEVGGIAVFILLLVAFTSVTAFQAQRIKAQSLLVSEERQRAETKAAESDRIVQILVSLFETANPRIRRGGDTLTVGTFLQEGESRLLKDLDELPEVQTRMKQVIGRMYRAQGNRDRAETFFREALHQHQTLYGEDNVAAYILTQEVGGMLARQGRRDSALILFREAIEGYRQHGADEELAAAFLAVAPILPRGDYEEKERMLKEADVIVNRLESSDDIDRASVSNQLGVFYFNQGRYEDSRAPFENALLYLEKAVGKSHDHYLVTEGNLAGVLAQLYLLDEAETLYKKNLAARRQISVKPVNIGLAFVLWKLANVLRLKGEIDEAGIMCDEAMDMIVELDGYEHPRWGTYVLEQISIRTLQGRYDEAEGLLQRALENRRRHFGEESVEVAGALVRKGALMKAREQWKASLEVYDETLSIMYSHYPDSQHAAIASIQRQRGVVLLYEGQDAHAYEALHNARTYYQQQAVPIRPLMAEVETWMAVALSRLGRDEEADALWETSYDVFDEHFYVSQADQALIDQARSATARALKAR